MSTTSRVVQCVESPLLTDAIATAEQVIADMKLLRETPGNVSVASMQKLNFCIHQAQSAIQDMHATIKSS